MQCYLKEECLGAYIPYFRQNTQQFMNVLLSMKTLNNLVSYFLKIIKLIPLRKTESNINGTRNCYFHLAAAHMGPTYPLEGTILQFAYICTIFIFVLY